MKAANALKGSLLALAMLAGVEAAQAQGDIPDVYAIYPNPRVGQARPSAPSEARAAAAAAYRRHTEVWGAPPIDTLLHGRPVIFWEILPDGEGGSAGSQRPYNQVANLAAGRGMNPAIATTCNYSGATGWCWADRYSVTMASGSMTDYGWALAPLISHEFVHLQQRRWWGNPVADDYAPHWVFEGSANGWGYGLMETDRQFTREVMARNLAVGRVPSQFAFFLGLRYYDQPLDVDRAIYSYPANHPLHGRSQNDRDNWERYLAADMDICVDSNTGLRERPRCREQQGGGDAPEIRDAFKHIMLAGYASGSFYRYMLLGNRQGPEAIRRMMRTPAPRTIRPSTWLNWMDRGIRLHTVPVPGGTGGQNAPREVPVWPGGVRQIYSEMIAELADFPDTHVQSREGQLRRDRYDSLLWSRGCHTVDLNSVLPAASISRLRMHAISARCFRVRTASDPLLYQGPLARVPVTFVVTASSRPGSSARVCEDLQLASRGQVLRNPLLSVTGEGDEARCAISWTVVFDPLRPEEANGNRGYQTVLLINAADQAYGTRSRLVDVEFVHPQLRANVNAQGVPEAERRSSTPRRRRLPAARPVEPQSSPLPQRFASAPDPDPGPCPPEERRAFECGPVMTVQLATGDVAVMAGATHNMMSAFNMFDLRPGAMDRDMGEVASENIPGNIAQFTAAMAHYQQTGAAPEGLNVAVGFEPIEFGTTGTFPARVQVSWSDGTPMGIGALDSLGPHGSERYSNGCIGGTPPSQATVTITRHTPGMLVGSVSARLFEENQGDDACTRPYVDAGTFTASFATNGHFPPLRGEHGGSVEINNVWLERYALEDLSRIAQMMPGVQLASDTSGGGVFAGGAERDGAAIRECPQPGDIEAFIESLIAQLVAAGGNPADMDQVREIYRGMPPEDLADSACDWIEQGRP